MNDDRNRPACPKCGLPDTMVEEVSGWTYQIWRCVNCDLILRKDRRFGPILTIPPLVVAALCLFDADGDDDFFVAPLFAEEQDGNTKTSNLINTFYIIILLICKLMTC